MAKRDSALPKATEIIQDALNRNGIDMKRLSEIIDEPIINIQNWFRNQIWAGGEISLRRLQAAGVITEVEYGEIRVASGDEPSYIPHEFRRQHPDVCFILQALEDEDLQEDFRHTIDGDLYDVVNKIRNFRRAYSEGSITE